MPRYGDDEDSPKLIKQTMGEVKDVVQETKEGIQATVDETREVVRTMRMRPVRRAIARRLFGVTEDER